METLRPAHEVYHRLRWGGGVPLDRVEVVVLDRVDGELTLAFSAFHPKGPIPFSRVLAFRIDGERVWDREARIDRVLGSGSTPGERLVRRDLARVDRLTVLTYNVLFDRYDQAIVRTADRVPRMLASLAASDAHLIALQEVEPPLLACILAEPWVVEGYHATDGPDGSTVVPYGQVLLSRLPLLDTTVHYLHGNKRHLVATVDLGDRRLRVVVVHLSSDARAGAQERRDAEIEALQTLVAGAHPVMVLGDFNQESDLDIGLTDVWGAIRPDDPGYTFDPTINALARYISETGLRRRIDRILVAGLEPLSATLIGQDDGPLPPSDHHGVVAELAVGPAAAGRTRVGVVLPLPPSVATALEPIRRRYDPNRWRWRPHVTLFHAEVDRAALASWVHEVGPILGEQAPLQVRFDRIEVFRQPGRLLLVAVADPDSTAALAALRAPLEGGPFAGTRPLKPHVTLARLSVDDPRVPAVRAAISAQLPVVWRVDRLAVWGRDDPGPMVDVLDLPLAGVDRAAPPSLAEALGSTGATGHGTPDLSELIASVQRGAGHAVALVGSAALGASLPEADVDLVVRAPDPEGARRRAAQALGGRIVDGEVSTLLLHARVEGLPRWVDVAFLPPDVPGPEDEVAAILNAVSDPGRYAIALRCVKAWATARQVSDPAWGFPSGLAYAIAAAVVDAPTPEDWIARTFETLLSEAPIGLGEIPEDAVAGPRPWVMTSIPPRRAVIRQLLPCTAAVLRDELERALLLAWDHDWVRLLEAALPTGGPTVRIRLGGGDRDAALGWLRGRARTLLAALSVGSGSVHPWPRPVPWRSEVEIRIGVVGVPPEIRDAAMAELQERFRVGRDRPAAATLTVTFRPDG